MSFKDFSLPPAIDRHDYLVLAVVAGQRDIAFFAAELPRTGIFCGFCKKALYTNPDTAFKLYKPLALGKGLFHN